MAIIENVQIEATDIIITCDIEYSATHEKDISGSGVLIEDIRASELHDIYALTEHGALHVDPSTKVNTALGVAGIVKKYIDAHHSLIVNLALCQEREESFPAHPGGEGVWVNRQVEEIMNRAKEYTSAA